MSLKLKSCGLVVLAYVTLALAAAPGARGSNCAGTSVGLTPLNDLAAGSYLGQFQGGLYPGGLNTPPPAHHQEGLARAAAIQPLSPSGLPSADGKIVLLSIGLSHTTQEFCSQNGSEPCDSWTFMGRAAADSRVDKTHLVIVNGAKGGQETSTWDSPTDPNYDRVRDTVLVPKGLREKQVQVVWVKLADAKPTVSLPASGADAYNLERGLADVSRALKMRYPNLQLAFFMSRSYAGYATSDLNPEPYAYESGFAVKWLIEAQIDQMAGQGTDPLAGNLDFGTVAPWLAWSIYPWADGLTPRSDGLTWACNEFVSDGTHPAQGAESKIGQKLLQFFLNSPYTAPWFRQ
ncbi:MAG: hypothetical protein QOF89_1638 [Acidobacteriota bacterium]|jgi:hypothetical protein|nr:hypothetical protein [Acidobacteriota bacterium]